MEKLREIIYKEGYRFELIFEDRYESELDFECLLGKGFTKALLNLEKFKMAFIESGGGIAWPNGFDICPNHLRKLSKKKARE